MKQQRSAEYRGYRIAGIRFSEDLAPELVGNREASEHAALAAYHLHDKAHIVMLTECGLISREIGSSLLASLRAMESTGVVEVRSRVGGGMHSGELFLIRELGEEVGGWAHLARSSADLGGVGERIVLRDYLLDTIEALIAACQVMHDLGASEADTLFPAYLHWQQIEPMTLGHYLSAQIDGFIRAIERGRQAYDAVNLSPAGAVVHSGSPLLVRPERVAELMGFSGVIANAFDAFRDWDHIRDCYTFLSATTAHLCILGEDLAFWAGSDQGFINFADRYLSGSSVLMQIKTVTPPNLIKGVLSLVVGARVTAELNDATPSHMSLLQRRYAFPQLTSSFEATLGAVRLLSSSLASITVDRPAARQRVTNSSSTAADLAGAIVEDCKLPWRSAHQICGILFRHRDERGLAQNPITSEDLDEAAKEYFGHALGLRQKRIDEALDPELYVRRRGARGGSAPKEVRRRLRVADRQLASDRRWLSERRSKTLAAAAALDATIDKLLTPSGRVRHSRSNGIVSAPKGTAKERI